MATDARWNHNVHYHPILLEAVPAPCGHALDVGCGEGTLCRQLRRPVPHVTGIDADERSIALARAHSGDDIEYIAGDFLTFPFEELSFDLITSVATIHHMDAPTALSRMRALLRPGGVLAILGLARSRYPQDLPRDLAGTLVDRFRRVGKTYWEHPSPKVWPPPLTYTEMRHLGLSLLPGAQFRRLLLWRYSLLWTKPG
jgi:2-polyprenyl-3-methyl-5-hydroxy-6-metoxy-1,4-benzoquinol methylase